MLTFTTPLLRELTEIKDSLSLINQDMTILGHTTEGISGFTFRISQTLNFNLASLNKLIDSLNEPEKEVKAVRDTFGLMDLMTLAERTEYDQISGLRHQIINQWRIVEDRKHELLKGISERLHSED